MDIHRSRFVPYPTAAVSSIAFSRPNDAGYEGPLPPLKLAIGRCNGSIEIWNPQNGLWVQEKILQGERCSIDALVWTHDPDEFDADGRRTAGPQRLFSIASSPVVTEWNLATGAPGRRSTGNFSEVWCLAAQPRARSRGTPDEPLPSQQLIAGCGDGALVVLSTADGDLQFQRFLVRVGGKRARCMCAVFQTREKVVVGFADGMIRVYDMRNGSMLRSMSLGVSMPDTPRHVLVWQVRCLPNGDIVSVDSNGEIKFWDGKSYSLTQRVSGHETDCVDLITSLDGKTVFSACIDGRIATYRVSKVDKGRKTWAKMSHRRAHDGELKAMAAFDSKKMSVIVTGGSDDAPMVTPLREYGKENSRSLPNFSHEPPVISAPAARLVVSWWEKTISVWRIAAHAEEKEADSATKPWKLVSRIQLNSKGMIRSVTISPDGRMLAASTESAVKLFGLRERRASDDLAVRTLSAPDDMASAGAQLLQFSPNGNWLAAVTVDGEVWIARTAREPQGSKLSPMLARAVELDRPRRTNENAFGQYALSVNKMAFSCDSSVLVVSDLSGHLDSWVLEGHEDSTAAPIDRADHRSRDGSDSDSSSDSDSDSSDDDRATIFYGQHWTTNPRGRLLPQLDSPPLILTFRPGGGAPMAPSLTNGNPGIHATRHNPHAHSHELPSGPHRLWVMTAKHHMYELDVLAGRLTDWSRRNPSSSLPGSFTRIRDRVRGALWHVTPACERLVLYGSTFVCMLDVGADLPASDAPRKRRRVRQDGSGGGEDDGDATGSLKRPKLGSGAGGDASASRTGAGHGIRVVKRHDGDGVTETQLLRRRRAGTHADDGDGDGGGDFALARRGGGSSVVKEGDESGSADAGLPRGRQWWCSFHYRPILGMVGLGGGEEGSLEVALVERPLWEARMEEERAKKKREGEKTRKKKRDVGDE